VRAMPRLRDLDPDFLDLDFSDVVEAFTSEKSWDLSTLGLDPDELAWWRKRLRKPHKPHRPSLSKIIEAAAKAAKKTGEPLTSVTMPDGTKLDFSKAADVAADDEVENWLRKQKGH
jgi:hypothetical protein